MKGPETNNSWQKKRTSHVWLDVPGVGGSGGGVGGGREGGDGEAHFRSEETWRDNSRLGGGVGEVRSTTRLTPGLKALPVPMKSVEGPGRGLTSNSGSITLFLDPPDFLDGFLGIWGRMGWLVIGVYSCVHCHCRAAYTAVNSCLYTNVMTMSAVCIQMWWQCQLSVYKCDDNVSCLYTNVMTMSAVCIQMWWQCSHCLCLSCTHILSVSLAPALF